MADFDQAIKAILAHEGRYSDDKNDSGGPTDYGISLRFLRSIGDIDCDGWLDGDINKDHDINVEDIKALSLDDAIRLYRMYFWDVNGYEKIHVQIVATKIFDLAVNMGDRPANKIAQRAVRSVCGLKLQEDGILGLRSLAAINMCPPYALLAAIRSEAAGYYRSIKTKGANTFIDGWLNRAYS